MNGNFISKYEEMLSNNVSHVFRSLYIRMISRNSANR